MHLQSCNRTWWYLVHKEHGPAQLLSTLPYVPCFRFPSKGANLSRLHPAHEPNHCTNCRDLCVSSMHKCRAFILPGPVAHASSTVNAHTAVAIVLFLHWYVPCPRKSDTREVTIMSFNCVLPFWRASRPRISPPRISPPRYPEARPSFRPPAGVGYRQILLLHQ